MYLLFIWEETNGFEGGHLFGGGGGLENRDFLGP